MKKLFVAAAMVVFAGAASAGGGCGAINSTAETPVIKAPAVGT